MDGHKSHKKSGSTLTALKLQHNHKCFKLCIDFQKTQL